MDLTTTVPRSPNDLLAGLVSLKRTIDKAKAYNEGHLGEYHYDCPHDKPLFAFLGTNGAEFAKQVKDLKTDDAIAEWVKSSGLAGKTPAQIEAFNKERKAWKPEPGSESAAVFKQTLEAVSPGRTDVTTWFELLDLDEGRPVKHAATA